jgi:hypothetical protein
MASRAEMIQESFIMRGINGDLRWVTYVGHLGKKKLYQVDHDWLYGELNNIKKNQSK